MASKYSAKINSQHQDSDENKAASKKRRGHILAMSSSF
jgi:hypothetical protein